VINIGSLNVLWDIPIMNKAGRGLPFNYDLAYNSSVWYPSGASPAWTPLSTWGWSGLSSAGQSQITYSKQYANGQCTDDNDKRYNYGQWTYTNVRYLDGKGLLHVFGGSMTYTTGSGPQDGSGLCPANGPNPVGGLTLPATDNSGLSIKVAALSGAISALLTDANGKKITPTIVSNPQNQQGTYSLVDTNGNEITLTNGQYTDTTGAVALSVLGSSPSNTVLTYTNTQGNQTSYTVSYKSYTVKTAFGCSGVTEYGPTSIYLVDKVTLPDSSFYQFAYEPTPGASGDVTGRVESVAMPTGGTVSYAYTGGNNGIECVDGTVPGITRTTAATGGSTGSTWSYVRTPTSTTSHTEVVDGLTNHLAYDFTVPNDLPAGLTGIYYETERKLYQGAETGTPVVDVKNCWSDPYPCSTVVTGQAIDTVNIYQTFDGLLQSGSTRIYVGPGGAQTESDVYDFGTSSSRGSLLEKQTWTYAASGNPNVLSSTQTFDASGDVLSSTSYLYDQTTPTVTSSIPQHLTAAGPRGNLTNVQSTIGSHNETTTITYDDTGQALTTKDPAGNITTLTYDPSTDVNLIGVSQKVGTLTLASSYAYYGTTGLLETSTDPNSRTTTLTYDTSLRTNGVTYPDGGTATTTYSIAAGNSSITQTVLHASGTPVTSVTTLDAYARQQRLTVTDSPGNDLVDTVYDANGNASSVSNPYRTTGDPTYGVTGYYYDVLGRLTKTVAPDTSTSTATTLGNTTLYVDAAGHQREVLTDGMGRISEVLEPNGTSNTPTLATNYSYLQNFNSSAGTTQTIIQQKGGSTDSSQWRTRTFTSDSLGRLVSSLVPESGTTNYAYSGFGNAYCAGDLTLPCTRTDARNVVTKYTYDALNRPTGMTYTGITPATPAIAYLYDGTSYNGLTIANGMGRRTGMTDASGTTAWSFDTLGRVAATRKTLNSVTKQANFTYNLDGTVNTLQDFGGTTLTYSYTPVGLQKGVSDGAGNTYASSGVYDAAGQLTALTHQLTGSSAVLQRTLGYNTLLQPSTILATSAGTNIQNLTLGYGTAGQNNGNVATIANGMDATHGRDQTYTYDTLNRVYTGSDNSHWGEHYGYDNWGNMLSKTTVRGSGTQFTVTANGNNELSNLTYDAAGNVILDQQGDHFAYDAEGRIVTGGTGTYTYDGDGNRVVKVNGSGTTLYWPSSVSGVVDESNSTATAFGRQIFVAGARVWSEDIAGSGRFLFQDHLGSTRITASSAGAVKDDYDYRSFGDIVTNYGTSPTDNHYVFTGYESDSSDNGTDYGQFRSLSLTLARFNRPDPYLGSLDPTNPQTFNRYAYALNNPVVFIDPTGLYCEYPHGDDSVSDGNPLDDVDYQSSQTFCESDGGTWFPDAGDGSSSGGGSGAGFGYGLGGGGLGFSANGPAPSKALCNSLNPPAGPINYSTSAANNAKMGLLGWYQAFKGGGSQDFKGNSAFGSPANQIAAGNFNFGASAAAKGWGLSTAIGLAGAGAFLSNVNAQVGYAFSQASYMQGQYGGPSSPNPGAGPEWNMGSGFPGFPSSSGNQGDQEAPNENQAVINGYVWYAIGCHS
jgi:RHS repeat-associated protein